MTRILLVEDNDEHADIVTRTLTAKKGWVVTRALSVKEGMLHAALKPFDIAIVDYKLPDGDGIDLLDSLRAQKPGLPVVFLTAFGSEEVAMRAMSRGAADYIVKGPHYQKDLAARVAEVLGRSDDLASVAASMRPSSQQSQGHTAAAAPSLAAPTKPTPPEGFDGKALGRVLKALVVNETLGAAVFDGHGKPVAFKVPQGVDASALGTALLGTLVQARTALRQVPGASASGAVLLDFEGGLVAVATVPGPAMVALLLDPKLDRTEAMRRVRDAAQQVWKAGSA
jgi:DNA-binding NarL/FixJ family response regulator